MRRAPLALVAVALLAGCGGSARSHTTTISRQQANTQDAAIARACGQVGNANAARACDRLTAANQDAVLQCGRDVTTNGSCVFADRLVAALKASADHSRVVLRFANGTTNPVTCRPQDAATFCQSQVSQVWVRLASP